MLIYHWFAILSTIREYRFTTLNKHVYRCFTVLTTKFLFSLLDWPPLPFLLLLYNYHNTFFKNLSYIFIITYFHYQSHLFTVHFSSSNLVSSVLPLPIYLSIYYLSFFFWGGRGFYSKSIFFQIKKEPEKEQEMGKSP